MLVSRWLVLSRGFEREVEFGLTGDRIGASPGTRVSRARANLSLRAVESASDGGRRPRLGEPSGSVLGPRIVPLSCRLE